ncbi:putative chromatin regulator PHD family [Arabidopsis thaliana]
MKCDYILHQTCACLPRKKHHHLHKHPLVLHPVSTSPIKILDRRYSIGLYWCDGCNRRGSGFVYECEKQGCEFQLDIGCASLPDPLIHGSHPRNRHSLFFTFLKGKCLRCKSSKCSRYYLTCMKCKIFLGLRCATLPSEVFYKHDKHALTLHYGEEDTKESDQYWCEICESKLDPKTWFYTCDSCRVTVHVDCLLGETFCMKLHHIIKSSDYEVEVVGNDGNSRPLCVGCKKRCVKNLIFGCKSVGYMCGLFCAHYLFD